jgi:hypothetical protein
LSLAEPIAIDRLAELKIERTKLASESQRLAGISARLIDAQKAESEALAAIGALGAAEIAEMTKWASEGAVGDPPKPDMEKRAELAKALAEAQAQAVAAQSATADIEAQQATNRQAIETLEPQIHGACHDAMQQELEGSLAELQKVAEQSRTLKAKLHGLRVWFANEARRLQTAGQTDLSMPYFQRAEALSKTKLPETEALVSDVDAAALSWAQRFSELKA